MGDQLKSVCIIPARGGSKRLPGKNVKLLAGKPLLAYTLEAASGSGCFDEIYVSSDDEKILAVAQTYGVAVDVRPDNLSGDRVKAVEVVHDLLHRLDGPKRWGIVAMCLPTCPFRTNEDVAAAMAIFLDQKHNCKRLIGISRFDFPPQLALEKMEETATVDMREPEAYGHSTRSQDIAPLYYPNGSIYISSVEAFMESGTFFGRPLLYYEMPPERSFDIDYPYQFDIADCMIHKGIDSKK